MPFVLDVSVTAVWALADEDHSMADAALLALNVDTALVPAIWWYELSNTLVMNERRGRIDTEGTEAFLRRVGGLAITTDQDARKPDILRLARRHRLTVYDAAYLELAWRRRLPLATLDTALHRAASAEGVGLFTPD